MSLPWGDFKTVSVQAFYRMFSEKYSFRAPWICYDGIKITKINLDMANCLNVENPRKTGLFPYSLSDEFIKKHTPESRKKIRICDEMLCCCGTRATTKCDAAPASVLRGRHEGHCAMRIHWIMTADDLTCIHYRTLYGHGEDFEPILTQQPMGPAVRKVVDDAALAGMSGRHAVKLVRDWVRLRGLTTNDVNNPTDEQIRMRLKNFKRRKEVGDIAKVQAWLSDKANSRFILYPTEERNFPDKNNRWVVVLSAENLMSGLGTKGAKVIGLDGVFKITLYRLPLWILLYVNGNEGVGAVYIFASHNSHALLRKGICCVKNYLKKVKNIDWNPTVMIDKDGVERAALHDFKIILCQFHIKKELKKTLKKYAITENDSKIFFECFAYIQRARTDSELNEALDEFQVTFEEHPAFAEHMFTHWFCERWIHALIDKNRPGTHTGLTNTNNYLEAKIKSIVYSYFDNRGHYHLSTALDTIAHRVIHHECVREAQRDAGIIPPKRTNVMKMMKQKMESAVKMLEEKKVQFKEENAEIIVVKEHAQYKLDIDNVRCTCPYFIFMGDGTGCKHWLAYQIQRGNINPKTAVKELLGGHGKGCGIEEIEIPQPTAASTSQPSDSEVESSDTTMEGVGVVAHESCATAAAAIIEHATNQNSGDQVKSADVSTSAFLDAHQGKELSTLNPIGGEKETSDEEEIDMEPLPPGRNYRVFEVNGSMNWVPLDGLRTNKELAAEFCDLNLDDMNDQSKDSFGIFTESVPMDIAVDMQHDVHEDRMLLDKWKNDETVGSSALNDWSKVMERLDQQIQKAEKYKITSILNEYKTMKLQLESVITRSKQDQQEVNVSTGPLVSVAMNLGVDEDESENFFDLSASENEEGT